MHSQKILSVEALRGFASIAVTLFHFGGSLTTLIPQILHAYGWLGVDIFFVIPLSLMGKNYRISQFPLFFARRLVRLEPPYIASLILAILLWHASSLAPGFQGDIPNYTISQLLFHLFYLIPLTDYPCLNPVFWTLAYEFVFYILVGLSFPYLINCGIEFSAAVALAILATKYLVVSSFDVRILELLLGVLIMRFFVDTDKKTKTLIGIAMCLIIIGAMGGVKTLSAVTLTTIVIIGFRNIELGKWALFLGGNILFPLSDPRADWRAYREPGPTIWGQRRLRIFLIAVALLISVVFAWIFYHLIEKHALRASKKIS